MLRSVAFASMLRNTVYNSTDDAITHFNSAHVDLHDDALDMSHVTTHNSHVHVLCACTVGIVAVRV